MEARLELYTGCRQPLTPAGLAAPGGAFQFGGTVMDLDYLLRRQQEERTRAQSATCDAARAAHEALAAGYESQIRLHGAVPVPVGSPAEH